jgi:hypothetical protein
LEFRPQDKRRGRGRGDPIAILDDNECLVASEEEIKGIYTRNASKYRLIGVIENKNKYRSCYNQLED